MTFCKCEKEHLFLWNPQKSHIFEDLVRKVQKKIVSKREVKFQVNNLHTSQLEVSHGFYPQLVGAPTSSPSVMESGAAVRRWRSPKAALKENRGTQQRFRGVQNRRYLSKPGGGVWMKRCWKFSFTKLSHQTCQAPPASILKIQLKQKSIPFS